MKTKAKRRLLLLLLALAGVIALLTLSANWWITQLINRRATAALGSPVRVSEIEMSLLQGRLALNAVRIENPSGFDGTLAEVDRLLIKIDTTSLFSDVIRIECIEITNPGIHLRRTGGELNVAAFIDALPPSDTSSTANAPGVTVDKLLIRGGTLTIDSPEPSPTGFTTLALTLPDCHAQQSFAASQDAIRSVARKMAFAIPAMKNHRRRNE